MVLTKYPMIWRDAFASPLLGNVTSNLRRTSERTFETRHPPPPRLRLRLRLRLASQLVQLGAELLTPFGREQLFDMGIGTRLKYGELLKNFTGLPVFRTTSEERMVQSA